MNKVLIVTLLSLFALSCVKADESSNCFMTNCNSDTTCIAECETKVKCLMEMCSKKTSAAEIKSCMANNADVCNDGVSQASIAVVTKCLVVDTTANDNTNTNTNTSSNILSAVVAAMSLVAMLI